MAYYITALTNDKARLIVSETRTTDVHIADMVERHIKQQGWIVSRRQEG